MGSKGNRFPSFLVQPWIDAIIKGITYSLDGIRSQAQNHLGSEHLSQANSAGCSHIARNEGQGQ